MADQLSIPERDEEGALNDILESTALERAALAQLINAEAEKIKGVLGFEGISADKILEFQESVDGIMQTSIELQKLIQEDLKYVLEMKKGGLLNDEEEVMEVEEEILEEIEGDTKKIKKRITKKSGDLE
ncbi:hypothetical protein [Fuchsiella alkaliacetigena]|uniref:hypothetical protein n=1 Tax=Fuchsiella alkaliacetigena TaxID=957042 RepID=UPI00200A6E1D|nr:hypothetical protein [Fuchsiella alkaliacetigena]MCK8825985.1 hypothetical protein [Fuchsiella alkaliacetigena]